MAKRSRDEEKSANPGQKRPRLLDLDAVGGNDDDDIPADSWAVLPDDMRHKIVREHMPGMSQWAMSHTCRDAMHHYRVANPEWEMMLIGCMSMGYVALFQYLIQQNVYTTTTPMSNIILLALQAALRAKRPECVALFSLESKKSKDKEDTGFLSVPSVDSHRQFEMSPGTDFWFSLGAYGDPELLYTWSQLSEFRHNKNVVVAGLCAGDHAAVLHDFGLQLQHAPRRLWDDSRLVDYVLPDRYQYHQYIFTHGAYATMVSTFDASRYNQDPNRLSWQELFSRGTGLYNDYIDWHRSDCSRMPLVAYVLDTQQITGKEEVLFGMAYDKMDEALIDFLRRRYLPLDQWGSTFPYITSSKIHWMIAETFITKMAISDSFFVQLLDAVQKSNEEFVRLLQRISRLSETPSTPHFWSLLLAHYGTCIKSLSKKQLKEVLNDEITYYMLSESGQQLPILSWLISLGGRPAGVYTMPWIIDLTWYSMLPSLTKGSDFRLLWELVLQAADKKMIWNEEKVNTGITSPFYLVCAALLPVTEWIPEFKRLYYDYKCPTDFFGRTSYHYSNVFQPQPLYTYLLTYAQPFDAAGTRLKALVSAVQWMVQHMEVARGLNSSEVVIYFNAWPAMFLPLLTPLVTTFHSHDVRTCAIHVLYESSNMIDMNAGALRLEWLYHTETLQDPDDPPHFFSRITLPGLLIDELPEREPQFLRRWISLNKHAAIAGLFSVLGKLGVRLDEMFWIRFFERYPEAASIMEKHMDPQLVTSFMIYAAMKHAMTPEGSGLALKTIATLRPDEITPNIHQKAFQMLCNASVVEKTL
jgi:hypothetical protein